ncbi:hypothetical protein Tco_0981936 [Tanacetum coccineum]
MGEFGTDIYQKGQNQSKNGQIRAREWKEDEKSRPKAYPCWQSQGQSLANYAWRSINGLDQMLGGQSKIEGPRLKVGERPRGLEASSHAYIKSLSHTEVV